MEEYDLKLFLTEKELDVIHDALALYMKNVPLKDALFADNILERFYEAIEDAGARE